MQGAGVTGQTGAEERPVGRTAGADSSPEATGSAAFECNICYEIATEPVVSLCGHLYCWGCLYRWLQVQAHCTSCPVCKAGIDEDKVIPIYGRGGDEKDPRKNKDLPPLDVDPIPSRPAGQRPALAQRHTLPPGIAVNSHLGNIIPTFFNYAQGQGQPGQPSVMSREQRHQAFLSRLLLMLGSFVIMCLLLF